VSIAQGRGIDKNMVSRLFKKTGAAKPAMLRPGLLPFIVLASFISMRPGLMQSKQSASADNRVLLHPECHDGVHRQHLTVSKTASP
jgi:hypothetical protein